MALFLDRLLAAVTGGAISGALAAVLDHFSIDSRIGLGVCLAAFGVTDKLLFDMLQELARRRRLRESLASFFDQLQERANTAPLWDELRQQLLAACDSESRSLRRRLLQAALADVLRLTHHTSFLALEDRDVGSLRQLDETLR
jgi:hypothetical protein